MRISKLFQRNCFVLIRSKKKKKIFFFNLRRFFYYSNQIYKFVSFESGRIFQIRNRLETKILLFQFYCFFFFKLFLVIGEEGMYFSSWQFAFLFVLQAGIEDGERQSSSRSDFKRQSTKASDGAGSSTRRYFNNLKASSTCFFVSPPIYLKFLKDPRQTFLPFNSSV